ncbi:pentapeptide repeat-containing protein [Desulfonema magnum]|uniref:Cyclic nucleotide-binding domain-containing protein, DUF4388 n=1 Tax=Desulfonema magnum TaxID=45655 RepID=A0A975BTJ7_9BACT|nr:pentapeptide repeat-containing protein [Desulfonema magnum]QTA91411.1 Cyclic nucleotide-binding domain-containing protein, DUF4388 [Desulfonema magnum]
MAKKEHLDLIKKEVSAWNKWRKNNATEKPDLSNINLCHSNLSRVNLSKTNLWEANFSKAKLNGADFSEADLCFADFSGAHIKNANFSGANLTNVDFSGANLARTDLRRAKLWGTNLNRADLTDAVFDEADISEADLSHAVLTKVSFRGTNFSDAKLLKVKLSHTDFSHAIFNHTDFTESIVEWSTFANVDLSKIKGLDTLRHYGPSSIDINTTYRSGGNIPGVFLRGTGVPDDFINYMEVITEQPVRFYSCFISYSAEDQAFAEQLHIDLCNKDVRCWTECRTEKTAPNISHSIFRIPHSALLMVISEHSINSPWIEQEMQTSFQEERRHKNIILFPLCLDSGLLIDTKQTWAADIPNLTDFSHWKETHAYQKVFDQMFHDICAAFPEKETKGVSNFNKHQPFFTSDTEMRSINFPQPPDQIKYKIIGDNGCPLYNLEDELILSEKSLLFPRDKAACLILLEDIMKVHMKYEKMGSRTGYTFKCSGCTGMIRLKYQKEKPVPVSLDKIGDDEDAMVSLLATFPMFQSLHDRDIKYIVSFLHRKRFTTGDVVIRQGDPGRNLYIVVSGRIEVLGEAGISIAFMGSGEVFGEMSLLSGNPVGATIKVLEPVTVLYLNGRDFKKILNEYPSLQMYFTRLLAARMAEINLARSEEFSSGMVGMLSEMPPSELLQTLNVNQKTGVLSLQLSKGNALLSFREGQLVRVEYNNKEDKEAFYEILREKEGRFKFTPGLPLKDIQAEEMEDFMWLLMEGMRRIDEKDY